MIEKKKVLVYNSFIGNIWEGIVMQGYFDIHSHILPGIDDGAKDMEETRRMLLIAYEEGIRFIIATPHYIPGKNNMATSRIREIYEEVNQIAEDASKEFRILLGNEIFYSPHIIEALKNEDALTIDNTRYILVEFSSNAAYHQIRDGLNNCIYAGYIPILAHAERYQCLLQNIVLVFELIKLGIYIQINYYCIPRGILDSKARFCYKLLKNEWVHFLGTDSHGADGRAPHAKAAVKTIKKRYGEDTVRKLLWDNPLTMLENKHLK